MQIPHVSDWLLAGQIFSREKTLKFMKGIKTAPVLFLRRMACLSWTAIFAGYVQISLASRISIYGGGASASGQLAVIHAIQQVLSGEVDTCIALGALMDLSYMECEALRALGAMGTDKYADEPEKRAVPSIKTETGLSMENRAVHW